MGDVGMAIQRAEDKTAQMQARAGAIDELLASGALDDPTGTAKDDITLELEALASTSDVESELASMKAALGAGPPAAAPALEGQPAPGQPTAPTAPGQYQAPPAQTNYEAPPGQGYQAPPTQPTGGDLR
jgi:phage shock protein A